MIVIYKPETGSVQQWRFRPAHIRQSEAEMIERRAGETYDEWQRGVMTGSAKARRVLLWHCMRTEHPVLRWEDVPDFYMDEVEVQLTVAELADMRVQIEKNKQLADDKRIEMLAVIDDQIDEQSLREFEAVEDEGKALSEI